MDFKRVDKRKHCTNKKDGYVDECGIMDGEPWFRCKLFVADINGKCVFRKGKGCMPKVVENGKDIARDEG